MPRSPRSDGLGLVDVIKAREDMSEVFSEYREVSGSEPLRQGDVLEAVDPSASIWKRHLLVITADCDFANSKNQGRVTCVPLLEADDYLRELQIPKIREQAVAKQITALQSALSAAGGPSISPRRLREWAREAAPEVIVQELQLLPPHDGTALAACTAIRGLDEVHDTLHESSQAILAAQLLGVSPRSPENAEKDLVSRLQATYTNPPGDALFLSAIAPSYDNGYFAYLRQIEQVLQPAVSIAPTREPSEYRRLARLQDRFTHAVVQRFAFVFLSIGLPKDYEDLRDLHADVLRERLR